MTRDTIPAKPLVIVGTGRCGSSLLHRLLASHPRLAWLSQVTARFPHKPELSRRALMVIDLPLMRRWTRKWIRPSEAYAFWDHHYPGFSRPQRDLLGHDVTAPVAARLRRALASVTTPRRQRLLIKVTGWPRIGFLHEVLPGVRFVHLYRDGRAVAHSLMGRPWWTGWGGPKGWTVGELTGEQRKRWEASDRSFLVLAGLEWELMLGALERAREGVSAERLLDVRYEDLCDRPRENLRRILRFAGIEWSDELDEAIVQHPLVNANVKWGESLTDLQRRRLEGAIGPTLARYGYNATGPS